MGSEITVGGKEIRPSFNHCGPSENGKFTNKSCNTQLTESLRNVCEDIRASLVELNQKQMLQCDLRVDIYCIRLALEKLAAKKKRTPARTKGRK